MRRVRAALVWVFSVLIGLIMISQGWPKFFHDGRWTQSFLEWGYPVWFRILIGAIEVGGGVALVVPRLAPYGASALAGVMLGAIVTLLLHGRGGEAATPLVYAAILAWIAWERWRRSRAGTLSRRAAVQDLQ